MNRNETQTQLSLNFNHININVNKYTMSRASSKKYDDKDSVLTRVRNFQLDMKDVVIIKSTEAYGYYYATLENILDVIEPKLIENGLWYNHTTNYDASVNKNTLSTIIYSISEGEDDCIMSTTIIDGDTSLAKMNKFMVEGSGITYFRRYHITTMLGLTMDEDTDAGGKRVKSKSGSGRSVEAASSVPTKTDFASIFNSLLETKTKDQVSKTFNLYKTQMDNDQIKEVTNLITEKYGA